FALLQMRIQSGREGGAETPRSIILAIEEPELYIHPHCQRLIFGVLKAFAGVSEGGESAGRDQVLYTTHSPAFVEIGHYERIAVVRKPNQETGTVVQQCPAGVLGSIEERK